MLPLWARGDLGAMAIKWYSSFPKAPVLLEPHQQIIKCHIQNTREGVLPLCRDAVNVFYNSNWLGYSPKCKYKYKMNGIPKPLGMK